MIEVVAEAQDERIRIELFAATAVAEPVLGGDHDGLRSLAASELESTAWLPLDRALLPAVRALLQGRVEG